MKVVSVDVDQAQSVAARFGVMSVPTLLLMRDGVVKDQFIGLASKQALSDRIDKVL
jgi:thioredoxin 1